MLVGTSQLSRWLFVIVGSILLSVFSIMVGVGGIASVLLYLGVVFVAAGINMWVR